jgi:hypothetical protein
MHEDGFSALSGIWRPGNTSALRQDVQAVDDFVTFHHGYIPCFAGRACRADLKCTLSETGILFLHL